MEFKTAYRLSHEVERALHSQLIVAGFRRQHFDDDASWALDLIERGSGRMVTLDEREDWQERICDLLPDSQVHQMDEARPSA